MLKKFKINVDGRSYDVIVEEESGPIHHGPSAVPTPIHAAPAPVVSPAPAPIAAAPSAPAPAAPVPAGANSVVAPLAGVIDSIDVRIGQTVNAGDKVAVLEAMKMKTEVFAKSSGTVSHIYVKSGESVDTGQSLLSIG
jgi:glutaconyl-CoA decarboxylase